MMASNTHSAETTTDPHAQDTTAAENELQKSPGQHLPETYSYSRHASPSHSDTMSPRIKRRRTRTRTSSPDTHVSQLLDEVSPSVSEHLTPDVPEQHASTAAPPDIPGKDEKPVKSKFLPSKRAGQACLRCRKQKLRCLGGNPCDRCIKSDSACEYGRSAGGSGTPHSSAKKVKTEPKDTSPLHKRGEDKGGNDNLGLLESSVANLLAGLANGSPANGFTRGEPSHLTKPMSTKDAPITSDVASRRSLLASESAAANTPPAGPSRPTYQTSSGLTRAPVYDLWSRYSGQSGISIGSRVLPYGQKTSASPTTGTGPELFRASRSPEMHLSQLKDKPSDARPPISSHGNGLGRAANAPGASIELSSGRAHRYDNRVDCTLDDPINTGIMDVTVAEVLFNFYIDHCHSFLPIVNVTSVDTFAMVKESPALLSAIIVIAARFYVRFTKRMPDRRDIKLDDKVFPRLVNLAEMHLTQTLLHPQHTLADMQAVLLVTAWSLRPHGQGHDISIVSSHMIAMGRRLGLEKVWPQVSELTRTKPLDREGTQRFEACLPRWRTWLCGIGLDGFLSLRNGNAGKSHHELGNVEDFLSLRLNQSIPRPGSSASVSLYGDVYLASLIQLAHISRDLSDWGNMLADREHAILIDSSLQQKFRNTDVSLHAMLKDLNGKVDNWSRTWLYSGSSYAIYLGPSARLARLHAEHIKLCINSYALKAGVEGDVQLSQSLKKALVAAMGIIQAHFDAAQSDLVLSFAADDMVIALAQAAVFLIRIVKAPQSVQTVLDTERSVCVHYVKMTIDLLETADLSETRLMTYLARSIREIARGAGIIGSSTQNHSPPLTGNDDSPIDSTNAVRAFGTLPHTTGSGPQGRSQNNGAASVDTLIVDPVLRDLLGLPGDDWAPAGSRTSNAALALGKARPVYHSLGMGPLGGLGMTGRSWGLRGL